MLERAGNRATTLIHITKTGKKETPQSIRSTLTAQIILAQIQHLKNKTN